MSEIIIDPEFMKLLPPLGERDLKSLEKSILKYGCMNPLVLWNDILIDGHNRYEIVTKHGLPFNTTSIELDTRDHVIIWIIETQIQRRNLTPMELTFFRGLHYNTEKKLHGGDRHSENFSSGHFDHLSGSTASRLSEQYNISPRTIRRDGEIADVISAIGTESYDAKRKILSGSTRISRKQLREMSSKSDEDIAETASKIETDTYEQSRTDATGANENNASDGSVRGTQRSLEEVFTGMSETLIAELQALSQNHEATEIKEALRAHINKLEEIYTAFHYPAIL